MDPRHVPVQAALDTAGFEVIKDAGRSILMGRALDDVPPTPGLPDGYESHTYRPGDELRWLEAKNTIFESTDSPGTFAEYYSHRNTFDPDEVLFVEYDGEVAAICAGVHHWYEVSGTRYDKAYLDYVGVVEEHRGNHLGDYICLHCMNDLKRKVMVARR
jgi:hypothetical protein